MSMTPLPSLQQLRFLAALAEYRHFGRAAAACAVTQSTLSQGLKELEERLAVRLVERSRRQVLLTPLGEEIVERGRRLLRDAEELAETAKAGGEPLAGPLRLGVIPTIGPYLLPGAMRGLNQAFPKLRLYLREEQTAPLLEKLGEGQLDLALLALPYELGAAVEAMALGEDRLAVALLRAHPLARLKRIDQRALAGAELLMMEDGHCLRSHALAACRLASPDHNEVFQGTSIKTLLQMVEAGIGVTLVPEMAVPTELAGSGLVTRPLAGAPPRTIALVWRRSSARKAEFRRLGEYFRGALKASKTPLPLAGEGGTHREAMGG
jgi:LysR family transcriptional regulator, hydrogen peroxide-inducible genes activator